jgi:DNA-binding NarL/FixJ family response regulator
MPNTKVLAVEDEAIVALEIQDRLIWQGCQVCGIAASGEKAIALIETAKILKERFYYRFFR